MPRLQILHHKSYHPYNEKNKQRVREDEAKARLEQLQKDQIALDAASESRLNALRRRAGTPEEHLSDDRLPGDESELVEKRQREADRAARREKKEAKRRERAKLEFDWPKDTRRRDDEPGPSEPSQAQREWDDKWQTGGHINFWADAENGDAPAPVEREPIDAAKRKAAQEADKFTMYLERPDRETKPWYVDKELRKVEETGEEAERRRARDRRADAKAKIRNDPLTGIQKTLAQTPPPPKGRPMSERERALAMLAKRKGAAGWETPDSEAGSWSERLERQKDRAGLRFSDVGRRGWD